MAESESKDYGAADAEGRTTNERSAVRGETSDKAVGSGAHPVSVVAGVEPGQSRHHSQTTTYQVGEHSRELVAELIKMELFDPRCQTDKDVMAATLSPFLIQAYLAGRGDAKY